MQFVASYLLTVCNHQNNFITMWSCLWKHTKFIGTEWKIQYRNIVEWSAMLGENRNPLTQIQRLQQKEWTYLCCSYGLLLFCPVFLFFSLLTSDNTSQKIPVSGWVSHWCQPISLYGCCLYVFVRLSISCVLPKTLQATGKPLLEGCRHRYSVLQS